MENPIKKDAVFHEDEINSGDVYYSEGNAYASNSASPKNHISQQQQQQQEQHQQQKQQQQPQQKAKRKHRRGKPKAKNGANKPYRNSNWKFQVPRPNFNGGGGRPKIIRSRSLVPYNTNKFLMEEHLAEVPSSLLTPSGRTRDSSFSIDSEDNYFFSLPEDEEEFLTKEFANVYEKARVERLENLTKQQLIEECLQIEDRYASDQGRQQQLNVQNISAEFMSKIRVLEEKVRELSRENYNLRCQLMRSAAVAAAAAAAASPPSAAPPTGAVCEPTPMDSSSVDSESDSSSSSSSSSSNRSSTGQRSNNNQRQRRQRRSCSSHSSLSDYHAFNDNDQMGSDNEEDALRYADAHGTFNSTNAEAKSTAALADDDSAEVHQSYDGLNSSYAQNDTNAGGRCIADDTAMNDEFPLFSPILGGVDSSPRQEIVNTSEQEAFTDNKGGQENESCKSNLN